MDERFSHHQRLIVQHASVGLRGHDPLDTMAAADLAGAVISLVQGDLPEALLGGSAVLGVPEPTSQRLISPGSQGPGVVPYWWVLR
ncbi:MAG TPA: hypothetical protein VJT31_24710 [Rugosimonospora sp.]|nr:hypothetical protein [Rugosimonospora sp.]